MAKNKAETMAETKMARMTFSSKSDDFSTKYHLKEDFKMFQIQRGGYQTIYMPSPADFAKDDKDSLHGTCD